MAEARFFQSSSPRRWSSIRAAALASFSVLPSATAAEVITRQSESESAASSTGMTSGVLRTPR